MYVNDLMPARLTRLPLRKSVGFTVNMVGIEMRNHKPVMIAFFDNRTDDAGSLLCRTAATVE
jgi:hypothetical protein